jgi:putative methyltransferase (TIGR04325 family)
VLYVNTTLQYIEDPRTLLDTLLRKATPDVVLLTRLMAGDVPDWITRQTIGGRTTPCQFLNLPSLLDWFAERGYADELRSVEDSYAGAFAKDVPENLRIPYDVNVVLRRRAEV